MWPVVTGLLAAVITACVTVYLGRRDKSGRIETSEAKDLWDTLRAELARVAAEAVALRAEIVALRAEVALKNEESIKVRSRIAELEAKLANCLQEEKALRASMGRTRRRRETDERT